MSINRRMDEQNMGYLYCRIALSNKREQTIDTSNRDESQNNYTKEEEAGMGVGGIYYMIPFMWNFRKGK